MDNDDLIKKYECLVTNLESIGTVTTDNLDPDDKMGKQIIDLINDFNKDNTARLNQLRLILSILKKSDGDSDV